MQDLQRLDENADPYPEWSYDGTVINDAVSPVAIRVACESCGLPLEGLQVNALLQYVSKVKRRNWTWTLASRMSASTAIHTLRNIVKELTHGDQTD